MSADRTYGGVSKPKRTRVSFTPTQLDAMEKVFAKTQYPDVTVLELLADRLNLGIEKVCTWFQNRRSKFRRASKKGHIDWMREQLFTGTEPDRVANATQVAALAPSNGHFDNYSDSSPEHVLSHVKGAVTRSSDDDENVSPPPPIAAQTGLISCKSRTCTIPSPPISTITPTDCFSLKGGYTPYPVMMTPHMTLPVTTCEHSFPSRYQSTTSGTSSMQQTTFSSAASRLYDYTSTASYGHNDGAPWSSCGQYYTPQPSAYADCSYPYTGHSSHHHQAAMMGPAMTSYTSPHTSNQYNDPRTAMYNSASGGAALSQQYSPV